MPTRCASASARILARQQEPELSDIHVVRTPDDLDPRMPAYVRDLSLRRYLPSKLRAA